MNAKEFFDRLKPWSKRKHRLLAKYLPPFSAKVATTTQSRHIYCIDAFAGAARYEDGSEGSPLLIARFSDECAEWKNPVFLKLINVEPDKKNEGIFESLENSTLQWTRRGTVRNIKKEFLAALPEIMKDIAEMPALFFIDPLGPTHVHFSHLETILSRRQRITELIINFDTDGLHRIARASISERTNPKAAQTDALNVDRILGGSEWRKKFLDGMLSTDEGETMLLGEYTKNLNKSGYDVVAYPIRESINSRPQYHFVYCTRHRDGVGLMNDFVREEEDLLYGEHIEVQFPLFVEEASLSKEISLRREKLRLVLKLYLENHHVVTRKQIRQALLMSNFGYFHSKDYNSVVRSLIEEGTLKEERGKTRINDDHILKYYPGM